MSAFVAIAYDDSVEILADGATIDAQSRLALVSHGSAASGSPEPSEKTLAKYGFPDRLQKEHLSECGADLMEAIRQTPIDRDGEKVFAVGDRTDCAIVDAAGVRVIEVVQWPDRPGMRIEPMRLN